jgi:hypothetical protein
MLKNLLKTWETLAPDEVTFDYEDTCLRLNKNTKRFGLCAIDTSSDLLPYEQGTLQGYIQRCIEDRGWQLFLVNTKSYSSIEIQVESTRYKSGDLKASKELIQTLLTAYLTALAAQRPVTAGPWRHFKGDELLVDGAAKWASGQYDHGYYVPLPNAYSALFIGEYTIEEEPQKSLKLYRQGDLLFYIAESPCDFADRVFYIEPNGKRWARKSEVFLGLVGQNQEHEGLLRFVEVNNAD